LWTTLLREDMREARAFELHLMTGGWDQVGNYVHNYIVRGPICYASLLLLQEFLLPLPHFKATYYGLMWKYGPKEFPIIVRPIQPPIAN
jgi:hypothetical protein